MKLPKLLLIAGNGRNIGKSTLAETIIASFSKKEEIIGLKVTTMYPEESNCHGEKETQFPNPFSIFEETDIHSPKDTARMLRAGASRVFYIRCTDEHLKDALEAFYSIISTLSVIVCESGSLRKVADPGVFIYIEEPKKQADKEKHRSIKPLADRILISERLATDFSISDIQLGADGWSLRDH